MPDEKPRSPVLSTALRQMVEAVRAGMGAITACSGLPLEVEKKSDASPVTPADRASELAIIEVLRNRFSFPIVAEESVADGRMPAVGESFFLVDPLDGTRDFIAGRPGYTVNVALIHNGVPVLGCVGAPASGRIYVGEEGRGAHVEVDGRFEPIGVRKAGEALDVTVSISHLTGETQSFLSGIRLGRTHRIGSSVKFGLVAEGLFDLYPRFGRTMQWDTAAGDAVLRAAGGATLDTNGDPLVYGRRNPAGEVDLANPSFIAIGDRSIARRQDVFRRAPAG